MQQCPTCLNVADPPKPKKSALEEELSKLESAAAVLEAKLHANFTRQHVLRKQLESKH